MIHLIYPKNNEEVCLQTDIQKKFVELGLARDVCDNGYDEPWLPQQRYDEEYHGDDYSYPLPVELEWQDDENRCYFTLEISKNEDMSEADTRVVRSNSYKLYNLETGKKYYWRVICCNDASEIGTFTTKATLPRTLYIDGVTNVRDIGGYKALGGKVKQGMVYRGGCLEDRTDRSRILTPEGFEEFKRLGIKTDIDIRYEVEKERALTYELTKSYGMNRVAAPVEHYAKIFTDEKVRASQADFIRLFADEANYPIYFHCWAGADRTGTIAFIIGALLGVDADTLSNDYEFTTLSPQGSRNAKSDTWQEFLQKLNEFEGDTLMQKAESFVVGYLGVDCDVPQRIRNILIECE